MPFLRTKRIKFAVELIVNKLTDVSLLNARLFAKIRLIDGGFEATTEPKELRGHTCVLYTPTPIISPPSPNDEDAENRPSTSVKPIDDLYTLTADQSDKQPFRFICRVPYNQETLRLDECRCKISIRKAIVERASKATKLGFVIINLSEFANASATPVDQSYLLDGYPGRQRQDNSRVHIKVRMVNQMADPLFKTPTANTTTANSLNDALNPQDRKVSHVSTKQPKDEVRRRQDDGERPSSVAESTVPQSSTLNSFSSSSTDSNAPVTATPQNARFSVPASSERRTSMPIERASWAAIDLPASTSDYSRLHHFSDVRRMSDDRIVVGASQNVPNRIQQTRRDADSVIEEVLAEAAVGLSDGEKSDGDPLNENAKHESATEDEDKLPAKHLELFVSRRNGDVYVGENPPNHQQTPRANFERVRIDSTQ
ncbi:C2 NT-type domain-containing protein [Aphelenchoides bicaudatus]|nr:C2 NT-type domain-containing protein [Aphelenchoides bicaudatus]